MVGVLTDETDPMVSVMKLEKAPEETYADIGGLDQQIQEIKVHYFSVYACGMYIICVGTHCVHIFMCIIMEYLQIC